MSLKLRRPDISPKTEGQVTNTETARFISGASKNAKNGKSKLTNFRLSKSFEDILEIEAMRTGQNKTTVLKAALLAYNNLDENQRNFWLLESAKF